MTEQEQKEKRKEEIHALRFSHDYWKLPEGWVGSTATLISVQYTPDMKEIPKDFLDFDTHIRSETFAYGEDHYPLNFKEGIILTFIVWTGGLDHNLYHTMPHIFCTIRRFTPEKIRYYRDQLFKPFKMVLAE